MEKIECCFEENRVRQPLGGACISCVGQRPGMGFRWPWQVLGGCMEHGITRQSTLNDQTRSHKDVLTTRRSSGLRLRFWPSQERAGLAPGTAATRPRNADFFCVAQGRGVGLSHRSALDLAFREPSLQNGGRIS